MLERRQFLYQMAMQECTRPISERFDANIDTGKVLEATLVEKCLLRRITLCEGVHHPAFSPVPTHMLFVFQGQVIL
jgi:hypothetical protein